MGNTDPIFPVMFNWTNHMSYWGREEFEVEYGIWKMQLEHWNYGPHHAWTKVGDDTIICMWQPYNGFEVFEPGSWIDGVADPSVFENMAPPTLAKKGKGGALMRIDCTDMSNKLNSFMNKYPSARECDQWKAAELQQFQALILLMRAPEMDDLYRVTDDRRQLRGDESDHGERWERLSKLAAEVGGDFEKMHRDGHCHEAVMWFVHHVSEDTRWKLAAMTSVPMLPQVKHECNGGDLCDE